MLDWAPFFSKAQDHGFEAFLDLVLFLESEATAGVTHFLSAQTDTSTVSFSKNGDLSAVIDVLVAPGWITAVHFMWGCF